jgi:hypothetical protein
MRPLLALALALQCQPSPTTSITEELRALVELRPHLSETEFTAAKQAVLQAAAVAPPAAAAAAATPPARSSAGAGFNVQDFGADPTGKNDSTAAIQATIDEACKTYKEMDCGRSGCGRSVADVFIPAGRYTLNASIRTGCAPGIHGEGTAILHQTNSSADIFYNKGVWRTQISGLHFLSGANHLHFGTNNIDTAFIIIERCVFVNASSAAIRMMNNSGEGTKGAYQGSASTQVTVSTSEFFRNEQVVINWCDVFTFKDNWVESCFMPTCSKGKALFENHDTLFLDRMLGVPHPVAGNDQRWIDNFRGMVIARDSRFGGEGGGFTVVVNKASFLDVPCVNASTCPTYPIAPQPPPRGPLPPGTKYHGNPQKSTIILDSCQIDSNGNKERMANIWLEQIPTILSVQNCQGFAYAWWWGPSKNQSFVKVDPALDLNGPQLDYAAEHPHLLRYDVGPVNSWGPPGQFWQLPQQLWPYVQNPVYSYETSDDSWGTDTPSLQPPSVGVWRSNQIVLTPLNATNSSTQPRGWRCVEGGKPGTWEALY